MPENRYPSRAAVAAIVAALAACTPIVPSANLEPVSRGLGYQAQWRALPDAPQEVLVSPRLNAGRCRDGGDTDADAAFSGKVLAGEPAAVAGERLTRGDLLELRLEDDEVFSGAYVVSRDGTLKLPFLPPFPAQGRTPDEVARAIEARLVAEEFYVERPRVSLLVTDFASARVAVAGAVFEPRTVDIGGPGGPVIDTLRQTARGAAGEGRNLSVAIRSAGGVRPDADLGRVTLIRAGTRTRLDLRAAVRGGQFPDPILIAGDQIEIPSRGCFQEDLMVPSAISPPGVSLYLSNLTVPATGNAVSAIGQEVREVPWGARYMQAVVDANCVGGTRATSAARSAALFTRNPITGVSAVVERSVERMRARADRDDFDPYLLPGDAIACYDSSVTNVADLVGLVGAVAGIPN